MLDFFLGKSRNFVGLFPCSVMQIEGKKLLAFGVFLKENPDKKNITHTHKLLAVPFPG